MHSTRLRLVVASLALIAALCFALKQPFTRPLPSEAGRTTARSVTPTSAAATDPTACLPPGAEPGEKFAQAVAARAARADALAKVAAFTDWLTDWRRSDAAAQPA